MNTKLLATALACSIAMSASGANAADRFHNIEVAPSYPYVEGELIWELRGDFTTKSDDPAAELNDIYGYLELGGSIVTSESFQINFAVIGEPVLDATDDRFFEDIGYYVQVLNAQFNMSKDANLVAGKFGPGFGTAWGVTPGIYCVDFAEDYELAEFIGLGLNHSFDGGVAGTITLGANVFFADTKALSDSTGTRRGRTRLADVGAENAEELNNFSITLDGEELPNMEGLTWHLGYRQLTAGAGDTGDEHGFVAGFAKETDLGDDRAAIFNMEFASFDNFGGSADDATYVTARLS